MFPNRIRAKNPLKNETLAAVRKLTGLRTYKVQGETESPAISRLREIAVLPFPVQPGTMRLKRGHVRNIKFAGAVIGSLKEKK
jgi:hypothetical protein